MIIKYITDKWLALITISALVLTSNVHADPVTSIAIDVGYRTDDVKWSIAGFFEGQYVNLLSELSWDNLKIQQIRISLDHTSKKSIVAASVSYGSIVSGSNQDSDYKGSNKTLEFSRSNNNSGGDDVVDFEIGFGYEIDLYNSKSIHTAHLIPLFGYSYHEQNLRMTDGFQTVSRPELVLPQNAPVALGPFTDVLNSTYQTQWDGLWLGIQLLFGNTTEGGRYSLLFKHHWPDYYAEANWNLRPEFAHPKSFSHQSNGTGNEFLMQWIGNTSEAWALKVMLQYQKWSTTPGIDIIYYSDGTAAATRLNGVEWQSTTFMLGVEVRI